MVNGSLGMTGGGEDGPVIASKNFQPRLNVGGVFFPGVGRKFKIGGKVGRAKLRNEFFSRVFFITKASREITVKAGFVGRPVGDFMSKGGIVMLSKNTSKGGI